LKEDLLNFSALDIYFSEFLMKKYATFDEDVKYAVAFLFFQSKQGHLCVQLKNGAIRHSKPFSKEFQNFILGGFNKLSQLIRDKKFKIIIETNSCFYLHKDLVIESKIVKELKRLEKGGSLFLDNDDFKSESKNLLSKQLITQEQFSLFEKCMKSPIVFLSGGPGSGKTYTASKLLEVVAIAFPNLNVTLTAPTGKAVSNLQEKIVTSKSELNYQVKTMHSLLKFKALQELNFDNSKLKADLIIVDEASMIDASLFALFLSMIKDNALVIFMGDVNQLPPVEGGNPFIDVVSSRDDLCVFFNSSHRFKNSCLSDALKKDSHDDFLSILKSKNIHQETLFESFLQDTNSDVVSLVEKHLVIYDKKEIDPEFALNKFNQFRVLGCVRQGPYGVDSINSNLYNFFLKKYLTYNFAYPILISENNFQMKLFNGINGVMIREKNKESAYFMIDNQLQKFPKLSLPKYEMGFVISVHKSQGSEYENVYIIIAPGSENFGKQVLYTAITRAKKNVKILGPLSTLEATAKNFEIKHSQIGQRLT